MTILPSQASPQIKYPEEDGKPSAESEAVLDYLMDTPKAVIMLLKC